MRKTLLLFSLLAAAVFISAQERAKYSEEWGTVTHHEMTMTEYENDKEAEALVVYDLGDYHFSTDYDKGFLLTMTRKTKIKILKQAGEKYANFEIPYYTGSQDWENIYEIEAFTYNWNGKDLEKTELNPKNIFEEKINDRIHVKKIALSNVKEGSVVEFRYTISTPYFVNMREWNFQQKIPVLHSELKYTAIPYYEYSYILKGATRFDRMDSEVNNFEKRFGSLVYKELYWYFGMNNLPAFRDEEFITSPKDYMVSLNFQLSKVYNPRGGQKDFMSTWVQLATDFYKDSDFGGYVKNSVKEAKKILPSLDIEGKSQLEQAKAITRYVKSMYNWNQFYGIYAAGKVSDLIKQKQGNVAELNLFLTGLLQASGIDATPILTSTRKNGAISKLHPFRSFFNYVIVAAQIDGKRYFFDATESLLDFDELPDRCIHVEGLAIKPKVEEWILTEQNKQSLTDRNYSIKIDPDNLKMSVDANYTASGYNAYMYRGAYLGKIDDLKKHLKEETTYELTNGVEVADYKELEKPFNMKFSFEVPIEGTAEKMFINPFCNLAISDNPFKQTQRTLHVDMIYFRGYKYKSTIEIPKGYVVEFLPKPTKHDSVVFGFNYSVQEVDGKIEVESDLTYKKAIYKPEEYQRLKSTLAAIIKHYSEMIVLKKKEL